MFLVTQFPSLVHNIYIRAFSWNHNIYVSISISLFTHTLSSLSHKSCLSCHTVSVPLAIPFPKITVQYDYFLSYNLCFSRYKICRDPLPVSLVTHSLSAYLEWILGIIRLEAGDLWWNVSARWWGRRHPGATMEGTGGEFGAHRDHHRGRTSGEASGHKGAPPLQVHSHVMGRVGHNHIHMQAGL
jgi:hypothetical protein